MNTFESSKERERDVAVALMGPIDAQQAANAALNTVNMDDDESSPAYDVLQHDVDKAYRDVSLARNSLYKNGYTPTEIIRGTAKAIDIVTAFKETNSPN